MTKKVLEVVPSDEPKVDNFGTLTALFKEPVAPKRQEKPQMIALLAVKGTAKVEIRRATEAEVELVREHATTRFNSSRVVAYATSLNTEEVALLKELFVKLLPEGVTELRGVRDGEARKWFFTKRGGSRWFLAIVVS